MKKIMMVLVCLMTMVISSCNGNDNAFVNESPKRIGETSFYIKIHKNGYVELYQGPCLVEGVPSKILKALKTLKPQLDYYVSSLDDNNVTSFETELKCSYSCDSYNETKYYYRRYQGKDELILAIRPYNVVCGLGQIVETSKYSYYIDVNDVSYIINALEQTE